MEIHAGGIPEGVHDPRTAIHYAQTQRLFAFYTGWSNDRLIATARRLDAFLRGPCARFGREAQSEFARLLIDMEREMARRLREAEIDGRGLPIVEGITWDPHDPLAGIAEGIDPFGMLDIWTTYLLETVQAVEARPRRRGGRRRADGSPGSDPRGGGRRTASIDLAAVITGIRLSLRSGSFAEWFLRHFSNSIITGEFPLNPSYVTGTGGVTRAAFAPPLESELPQLRGIYLEDDVRTYETTEIRYFARMKRELQRVVDAWVPYFREQASGRYQGERRWDLLNTPEYRAFHTVAIAMSPPEIDIPQDVRREIERPH